MDSRSADEVLTALIPEPPAIRHPSTARALRKLSTTSSRIGRYRAAAHAPTRRQIALIWKTNVRLDVKGTAAQIGGSRMSACSEHYYRGLPATAEGWRPPADRITIGY